MGPKRYPGDCDSQGITQAMHGFTAVAVAQGVENQLLGAIHVDRQPEGRGSGEATESPSTQASSGSSMTRSTATSSVWLMRAAARGDASWKPPWRASRTISCAARNDSALASSRPPGDLFLQTAGQRELRRRSQLGRQRVARGQQGVEPRAMIGVELLVRRRETIDELTGGAGHELIGGVWQRGVEPELVRPDPFGQQAQHRRHAGSRAHRLGDLLEELLVAAGVRRSRRAEHLEATHVDGGVDVLGAPPRAPVREHQAAAAADERTALDQCTFVVDDFEGPDGRGRVLTLEHVHEREVGDDPLGIDARRLDVPVPDRPPIAFLRVVALGLGEHVEEVIDRRVLADLVEEVDQAGGVAQHLQGLDARRGR